MRKQIQSIAPARMTLTEAGVRLGLNRAIVRRLVDEGRIKRLRMPDGIKANLLASSVDDLAAEMYGDTQKQAG